MYYSPYSKEFLQAVAARLREVPRNAAAWCIFDNTAAGAALPNALELLEMLWGSAAATTAKPSGQ
jgi:uncharacterized protein YecE (DUF72 family)